LSIFNRADVLQTDKAVYIAVTNNKEGKIVTTLDRKINLAAVRGVALTNLRDDWMVSTLYSTFLWLTFFM